MSAISKAKEYIEHFGHAKTSLENEQGEVCLNGALFKGLTNGRVIDNNWMVLHNSPYGYVDNSPESHAILHIIKEQFPDIDLFKYQDTYGIRASAIASFNDDPRTTVEDVLLVLDKAELEMSDFDE